MCSSGPTVMFDKRYVTSFVCESLENKNLSLGYDIAISNAQDIVERAND